MTGDFTKFSDDSIWDSRLSDKDPASALEFLNNPENLRFFSTGLTELIQKYGYQGEPDDIDARTSFLYDKLSAIGVKISKNTIKSWFGERQPYVDRNGCTKIYERRPYFSNNSRSKMFQICFALSATFSDTKWFFHHVYFDRNFNCHCIEEAVYYYCILNRLPYARAQELITVINSYPEIEKPDNSNTVYTQDIINFMENCSSEEKLLHYFKENKYAFRHWNQTALRQIHAMLDLIQGKPSDRATLDAFIAGKSISEEEKKQCGLVIQEYFKCARNVRLGKLSFKQIASQDFMLRQMIVTDSGLPKETHIPTLVKRNFPSKHTLGHIIKDGDTSTNYNEIRKCLILLKFYYFWVTLRLKPEKTYGNLFDFYCAETDALLISCNYEPLYSGNPYDWLFLTASTMEEPLDFLRGVIYNLEYSKEIE